MAGRTPKPTALKVVTGNAGKRALTKQEPDPAYLQDLTPPEWLDAKAKSVWSEIAPHLSKARLLTHVDVQAFAMGCVAIAQYRQATTRAGDNLVKIRIETDEDGSENEAGEHLNPWLLVQSMAFKQAMAIFQQFGMSPAARTRIAVQPQGDLFSDDKNAGRFFT